MSSQLQNKLLQYEVSPRAEVWNKIAASLEETVSLSEKLYQFEEVPPKIVWDKIETLLNEPAKEKTKVVPFFIRYRRGLKYSGSVAAMILIAVLVSLLISKKTESEVATENLTTKVVKKDTNTSSDEKYSEEISKSVTKSLQRDNNAEPSFSKRKRTKQIYSHNSFSLPEDFLPRIVERDPIINSSSIPSDKYMIYSDRNGNAIRLPKKIFNSYACPVDNYDCKRRLKELKDRFASAAITSDFTGILEILKSLQENQ